MFIEQQAGFVLHKQAKVVITMARYWRCKMGRKNSRILDAVHETASDLHKLGFIDKQAMEGYDALCIPPVP